MPSINQVGGKYDMTQLKAMKNAQHAVVVHMEKAGVTGPMLRSARNVYSMYVQMVRSEWKRRLVYSNGLRAQIDHAELVEVDNEQ
jgi:hypothetical protein